MQALPTQLESVAVCVSGRPPTLSFAVTSTPVPGGTSVVANSISTVPGAVSMMSISLKFPWGFSEMGCLTLAA